MPTLLAWERIAGIDSQANYAQQNDTAIDHVPEYAYLTLNRDGSYAAAWRLPNTYTVNDQTIQQHSHTGKAKQVRQAVHDEDSASRTAWFDRGYRVAPFWQALFRVRCSQQNYALSSLRQLPAQTGSVRW